MRQKETINLLIIGRRVALLLPILFCTSLVRPGDVVGQRNPRGSFTDVGFTMSGGPLQGFGDHSGTQGDLSGHLNVIHIKNFSYTGIGVEASYKWDASMELFSVMARIEAGLKKGRPVGRNVVGFNTLYLALMAGYAQGTAWDQVYVDLYDAVEEVAVNVNGIPLYASLGWRRIGRLGLNLEAIGGLTVITSQEAEEFGGTAPTLMPGIGMRIGLGFDTFFYTRERPY